MSIDRRTFLGASSAALSGALSALGRVGDASAQDIGPIPSPVPDPAAAATVTPAFVRWMHGTTYDSLPDDVRHGTKRYILDAVGCGLAGFTTDKANLSVAFARSLGGRGDARILGFADKVPVTAAAFANGELINALDYDAIPHIPPMVVSPVMAAAEMARSDGKDVILATALAHEMSGRIGFGVNTMGTVLAARHTATPQPQFFGISAETVMASAAAASKLLGLDEARMAYAIGVAGYFCPVPASHDWETGTPKTMVKYTPMGWVCQGAISAALLAREGYTGNPIVLDGVAGFPVFYAKKFWDPQSIIAGLGDSWSILHTAYKPYAACRFMHAQLDCTADLLKANRLAADSIESVYSLGAEFGANPDMLNVRTQEDAQFSIPYMLANLCRGFPLTADVQSHERLQDPATRAFMRKIRWGIHPENKVSVARVEIVANGKTYVGETTGVRGDPIPGYALTDHELSAKFHRNASPRIGGKRARAAAEMIWNLDEVHDIGELSAALSS